MAVNTEPMGKPSADAILARIPDRMCQQCGLAPATAVRITVKGLKRYVCGTCKARKNRNPAQAKP